MDIFTDVSDTAFQTWSVFWYPESGRSLRALAVKASTGQYLTACYALLLTIIIMLVWNFIVILVLAFFKVDGFTDPMKNKFRSMAMVGLWNSREPLTAFMFTVEYITAVIAKKAGRTVIGPAFVLFFIALLCVIASNAVSIVVAGMLVVGNLAPATASTIYMPLVPKTNNEERAKFQAILGPAALRALGSSEAAQVTVRQQLNIDAKISGTNGPSDFSPSFTLNYKYTVTGRDMGLQHFPLLRQDVVGSCETAYDWFARYDSVSDAEIWNAWGNSNLAYKVPYGGAESSPPRAQATLDPSIPQQDPIDSKTFPSQRKYAVIIYSAKRLSYRSATDPWYFTEPYTNDTTSDLDAPTFRVRSNRPPLSCWQNDTWTYNGKTYKSIFELSDALTGVFPKAWLQWLQFHFALPKIVTTINSAGVSALTSSMSFVTRGFDAQAATVQDELTRLLVAAYISSSHVFRDTLMMSPQQGTTNLATDTNGQPQKGVDQFVVSTPQVTALRFSILVGVPIVFIAMSLFGAIEKMLKKCIPGFHEKAAWYEAAYLYGESETHFVNPKKNFRRIIREYPVR
ncbi:hypothetical protein K440DRAFT_551347 [Wilcoxina mikolae CBS 423.85]|nr:hypothetical protein K440DRAFT_551347 [Wilcoxina mikolae CBS 423.85]